MRRFVYPAIIGVLLLLSGCEVVDRTVLQQAQAYWPQAELFHPRRDTILIETRMSGISVQFAGDVFKTMLAQHGQEMRPAFQASGYTILLLGFDGYHVLWSLPRERYWVLNRDQYIQFYQAAFHALPTEVQQ